MNADGMLNSHGCERTHIDALRNVCDLKQVCIRA